MIKRFLIAATLTATCWAGVDPAREQVLVSASQQMQIRGDDAKPFQMEVDFRAQINVPREGHLTLKWMAKDRWWQKITMGDYTHLEIRRGDTLYTVRNWPITPLRISQLGSLLHGFTADPGEWEIKHVQSETIDNVAAECLRTRARHRRGWNPEIEVCLNQETNDILSDDEKDGDELRREEFFDYRSFGSHRFPHELKLSVNGSVAVKANLVSLESASFDDHLTDPPPGAIVRRQCENMVQPVAIKQPDPSYPKSASQNKIQGRVTVSMTVLPDGSVDNVQFLERAGHEMDEATQQILKTWKFKPARCGDEPITKDIVVEVDFRLE